MTFLELYGEQLNIELASSDTTQLFTTARRKAAINRAQDEFVRYTGCTKVYGDITIVDGTAEYDLEFSFADYIRLAGSPSIKITTTATGVVRWIQGPRDFPRRDVEELDRDTTGWRAVEDGTPSHWYLKENGGATSIGLNPGPAITSGDTWLLHVPYIADPADLTADAAEPFTFSTNVIKRLRPYHQALVHYAAALLEPLRKNYSGVQRQQALYSGYVAQYLQQQSNDGRDQVTMLRNYYAEAHRSQRPLDPTRFP